MIVTAFCTDPLCNNAQANAIAISALVDGDVNLGDSVQDGSQLNNCDAGVVTCDNAGVNQVALTADGANAETNLETNTQTRAKPTIVTQQVIHVLTP